MNRGEARQTEQVADADPPSAATAYGGFPAYALLPQGWQPARFLLAAATLFPPGVDDSVGHGSSTPVSSDTEAIRGVIAVCDIER